MNILKKGWSNELHIHVDVRVWVCVPCLPYKTPSSPKYPYETITYKIERHFHPMIAWKSWSEDVVSPRADVRSIDVTQRNASKTKHMSLIPIKLICNRANLSTHSKPQLDPQDYNFGHSRWPLLCKEWGCWWEQQIKSHDLNPTPYSRYYILTLPMYRLWWVQINIKSPGHINFWPLHIKTGYQMLLPSIPLLPYYYSLSG